jgi:hypothetical protein
MRVKAMRKAIVPALAVAAVTGACLALAGCPLQSTYPATVTPIYAATAGGGLWVYDGTGWTNYTTAGTGGGLASSALNSVVVSGSGSGALILAGGNARVSQFNGASWSQLTTGLASATVKRLFVGSNVYAATTGGLAILNNDGTTWTNNASVGSVNDVFAFGSTTYVATSTSLYIYNGTGLVGGAAIPASNIIGSSASVTAVSVDSTGDVIAGTDLGLAVQFAGSSTWTSLLPGTPAVTQVTVDSSGFLYAATSVGLYKIGSSAVNVLLGNVLSVSVDGAGKIYAGLTAGGLKVSSDGGSTWASEPALGIQSVTSVVTTAPLYSF